MAMPISGFRFNVRLHRQSTGRHRGEADQRLHCSTTGAAARRFACTAACCILAIITLSDPSLGQRTLPPTDAGGVAGQALPRYALEETWRERAASPPQAPSQPTQYAATDERSSKFEQALWSLVRNSKNTADYDAYLAVFPDGRFAKQAREAIARLRLPIPMVPVASPTIDRPAAKRKRTEPEVREIQSEYAPVRGALLGRD